MIFNYKVCELDVKVSFSEYEGEGGSSKQLFGCLLSRANEHRLVEAIVQALHPLEAGCRHERYQPVCAYCIVFRPHHVRDTCRASLVHNKVHRDIIDWPVELPDLPYQIACLCLNTESIRLHPDACAFLADCDQASSTRTDTRIERTKGRQERLISEEVRQSIITGDDEIKLPMGVHWRMPHVCHAPGHLVAACRRLALGPRDRGG